MIYRLYAEADCPRLDDLADVIAGDDDLPGAPRKDLISKIVSGDGLASQQDTVTVAAALARHAGRQDVDIVAAGVRQLWIAARAGQPTPPPTRLGRPIRECDPLALEVHPAITVGMLGRSQSPLPAYAMRAHDGRLHEIAETALAGDSRMVTLVGGSSTGKTRACWELALYVDQRQPGVWRLWHPYDPSRPAAIAAAIGQVGPHTIIWLNEAQFYLGPPDVSLGERIAAGLRTLLQDPARAPVLVVATMWPQYWSTLTPRPEFGRPDPHTQTRDLLTGTEISIAERFTPTEVAALNGPGTDVRLLQAARHAEAGRITQYLAGAPELLTRYRTAPPAARAIIDVAIDARRLGHSLAVPHALLEHAAPGYLDDHDWDALDDDWLEHALTYTARPCNGARGILTRVRSRPGRPTFDDSQPCYRLADYIEQVGRAERAAIYPPESLWTAFTTTTNADLLRQLALSAKYRGRRQHAIWLLAAAADHGDTAALRALAEMRAEADDLTGAEALFRQAADSGDVAAMNAVARLREQAGDTAGAEAMYRQAAAHGDTFALRAMAWRHERDGNTALAEAMHRQAARSGDTHALWDVARLREQVGDANGAEAVAVQAADRGDTGPLRLLANLRKRAGDSAGAEALYAQAADRGDDNVLWKLIRRRDDGGDSAGAEALAMQAADQGNTEVLRFLGRLREMAGDTDCAETLYRRAVEGGNSSALGDLALLRDEAGDTEIAETLAIQAANSGDLGPLSELVRQREDAGNAVSAESLAMRAADQGDVATLFDLARQRETAGETDRAETLYRQAADRGHAAALRALARLREGAGDRTGAEELFQQAADRGSTAALHALALRRVESGDIAGAETLYRQAANHGDTFALRDLAQLREKAGDPIGADRVRRFGLTGAGEPAAGLNFASYGGPTPPETGA